MSGDIYLLPRLASINLKGYSDFSEEVLRRALQFSLSQGFGAEGASRHGFRVQEVLRRILN